MKFEIEAEVITKVVSMIMENNNRNAEVAMKVLDKTLTIADKIADVAIASIKESDTRSRIRFEQEQEEYKIKMEDMLAEKAERKAAYAEAAEERKLAAARREKEFPELQKSQPLILKKKKALIIERLFLFFNIKYKNIL